MAKLNLPPNLTPLQRTSLDEAMVEARRRALLEKGINLCEAGSVSASAKFVTQDPAMMQMLESARMLAEEMVPVLITGPSGTGKELVARILHQRTGKLSPVNCAGLVDSLFESEIFGYVAGAFTGALHKGKMGILEASAGGTVFFDEIGELPPNQQSKLLRVLQTSRVRRVGSDYETPIDVRFIFATNRNMRQEVEAGRFREDLYFRISTIELFISPLSSRDQDIPLIIADYCKTKRYGIPRVQPPTALYSRGNVRAIQRWLDRIELLGLDPLDPDHRHQLYGDWVTEKDEPRNRYSSPY